MPLHSVTVVVPYYERPGRLMLTLAGLERQSYPRELFEVVVVDDGSDPPLVRPVTSLDLRVEYQEDLGFGLARARNTGARAARGDILVFLDCDMIPEDGWLAAHARWHHVASDVVTVGFRFHVDPEGVDGSDVLGRSGTLEELFEGREVTRPEWIETILTRTRDLTSDDDDLFRVLTGGNFGISRGFFETVGGFDETFTQWGGEDTDFAYRAYTLGGVLVPERQALCWHQGPDAEITDEERHSRELQIAKMSQLVAHPFYRHNSPGRTFTVPRHVVTLRPATAPAEMIRSNIEELLASKTGDLAVWIEDTAQDDNFEWLRRLFQPDPRVFFGPPAGAIQHFPLTPFHITMECGTPYDEWLIGRLRTGLGKAASATAHFPEGPPITIVRSWALHRAGRTGLPLSEVGEAAEFTTGNQVPEQFDRLETMISAELGSLESRLVKSIESRLTEINRSTNRRFDHIENRSTKLERRIENQAHRRFTKLEHSIRKTQSLIEESLGHRIRRARRWAWRTLRLILKEAASVRSIADARRFARWFAGAARNRIGRPGPPPTDTASQSPEPPPSEPTPR